MDDTIILNEQNEVYFRVECNLGQSLELKEYFSCFTEGYRFNPRYKARVWDGKVYYFDPNVCLLPIGLLSKFLTFCEEYNHNYKFNFDIKEEYYNDVTIEKIREYTSHALKNYKYEARESQIEAIFAAINERRGILLSATGTGKSLIIYVLIRMFIEMDLKILLVVPNTGLVEQMYSDFKEYGWEDYEKYVEMLYSGKKPTFETNVLISTWQSIPTSKKDDFFYAKYDVALFDEVHTTSSISMQKILKKLVNASYRIGTTGTMPKEENDKMNIISSFAEPIFTYTTQQGIEDGILSKMRIHAKLLKYNEKSIKTNKGYNYPAESEYIENYKPRMKVIKDIIENNIGKEENTIILCRHVKHIEEVAEYLKEHFDNDIEIIHGKVKATERERIRQSVNERTGLIIVATYETMSTGININRIHHIIFGSSYKKAIKIIQAIGRGLRLHATKSELIVWDIVDNIRRAKRNGGFNNNYCWDHFLGRLEVYEEEGHSLTYDEIEI